MGPGMQRLLPEKNTSNWRSKLAYLFHRETRFGCPTLQQISGNSTNILDVVTCRKEFSDKQRLTPRSLYYVVRPFLISAKRAYLFYQQLHRIKALLESSLSFWINSFVTFTSEFLVLIGVVH